ncbi:LytTR family DNA-binding domain-containing protein [Chitinophaga sp. HK235]|uniref:LytTR family DNA-binding domain-containing protein n=1 Tax=Chitinophaga sp. HK235 TaxID=2952571 RepID=UPI001BA92402|nr:LytTR family DNA-binding domain-containing protein [Chitinophaga sp. HK235]
MAMQNDYFILRCGDRHEKIRYDELQYLEVMNDHILLHMKGYHLATLETLDWIMSRLPLTTFQRVHQWFVVSYRHITQLGEDHVMIGSVKIPVTRQALLALAAGMAGYSADSR